VVDTAGHGVCSVVDAWILAAKHELEIRHSMHSARSLLQQAIASNPESQQLWLEVRTRSESSKSFKLFSTDVCVCVCKKH